MSARVTVVVPALDEEGSVAAVVRAFRARPEVAAVVVVDNGSRDATAARAREAGARVIAEARRGYGAALRAGIGYACAQGAEVVALVEADGTFAAEDLPRLLGPLETHALVLGSRTAAMGGLLAAGNRLVARIQSALWPRSGCRLSDVGCTYRALTRTAWQALAPGLTADGPELAPQMVCEAFRRGLRVSEVPVRYGSRTSGASKHTGSAGPVLRTALRMLRAILAKRLERGA
ncbi:MAG TPA: glycosyltransferase family 2 protein [Planctomycetota bacterium]